MIARTRPFSSAHLLKVAILGFVIATANVSALAQTVRSLTLMPTSVAGGTSSTGKVTLSAKAGSSGVIVALTSSNGAATVPGSVSVPAGSTTGSFPVSTSAVATTTTASVQASLGNSSAKGNLTILAPKLSSLSFNPSTVTGGTDSIGTVQIASPAPASGLNITLTSSNSAWGGPGSVVIPSGATSATFDCSTKPVGTTAVAKVTAKVGTASVSANLTIKASILSSLSLNPSTVGGGANSLGTLTLSGPAPSAGLKVTLASSSTVASVPKSVVIGAGSTTGSFIIKTNVVTHSTPAKITATAPGGTVSATLNVSTITLSGMTINPSTVAGGASTVGTVTLNGPAPSDGVSVTLISTLPSVGVPSGLSIPAGATSATFPITTRPVNTQSQTSINAGALGAAASATLTITPPNLTGISLTPTAVNGGAQATGTVTLGTVSPTLGTTISLSSNQSFATVPATVTVAAGTNTATFTVNTLSVAAASQAVVTATLGSGSFTATLTVNPPVISALSVNPATVLGGSASVGTVTISNPAPSNGTIVVLSSNSSAVTVPVSVVVSGGATTANFNITTQAVASATQATILGTTGTTSIGTNLTVNPPGLQNLTLNPNAVNGGASTTGTITLTGPAPTGGFSIALTSDNAVATVPANVLVPAGATSATFTVTTTGVQAQTIANITGTDPGNVSATAKLTVNFVQVQTVPISVRDITYDKVSGKIWAACGSDDVNYPNSIVAVNPADGSIGMVINVGASPNFIRVTDDGQFAYTNIIGDGTIRRFNLSTGLRDAIFTSGGGNLFDLETVPGQPHSWVSVSDPTYGVNVRVYDDGVQRQNVGAGGYAIKFAGNSSLMYGDGHGGEFVDTLDASAIHSTGQFNFDISGFAFYNGLCYTKAPAVVDPVNRIILESIPTTNFLTDRGVAISPDDNRIYYITWGNGQKRILTFDLNSYKEYPYVAINDVPGGSNDLIACGNHTVAFYSFGDGVAQNIVLIHGVK